MVEGEGRERAIDLESRNKRERAKNNQDPSKIQFQLKAKIEEAQNTV